MNYFQISTIVMIFIVGIAVGVFLCSITETVEEQFIMNAPCDSLQIYLDAAKDDKDFFAYWTSETQETLNFRITQSNTEIANDAWKGRGC